MERTNVEDILGSSAFWAGDHLLVVTTQPLKSDPPAPAATVTLGWLHFHPCCSRCRPRIRASTRLAVIFRFGDLEGSGEVEQGATVSLLNHPHHPPPTHPEQTGPLPRPQPAPSVRPEGETFPHPGKDESHLRRFWEQKTANEVQTE